VDGKHPVLSSSWQRVRRRIAADTLMLITGPNMAGKSTCIRQVADRTVVFRSAATCPQRDDRPVDRTARRISARMSPGQSTFMADDRDGEHFNNATDRRS
jgi:DNA mismatch repair ATPase MutS